MHEPLGKGFDDVIELAHAAGPGKRVLVVGHNPGFEQVLYDLTGARVHLKKGRGRGGAPSKGTARHCSYSCARANSHASRPWAPYRVRR